jgi:hypothetical protein
MVLTVKHFKNHQKKCGPFGASILTMRNLQPLAIQEETGGLMVCGLPGHYRLLSRYPGYALQVKLGTIRENVDFTAVVCFILEKGLGFFGVSSGFPKSPWVSILNHMGLSENSVQLHPMVLLIIIPTKWL